MTGASPAAQDAPRSTSPDRRPPLFEALVELADEAIAVFDAEGLLVYANPAAQRAFAPAPGERGMAFVHEDDLDEVGAAVARVRAVPGSRARISGRLRQADGSWRDVESLAVNLLHLPEVRGVVYLIRDVTERRGAERELDRQLAGQRLVADLGLRSLRGADPGDLARHALEGLCAVLHVDHAHLLDAEDGGLRVREAVGPGQVAAGLLYPAAPSGGLPGQSPAGQSLAQRGPVVVDDLSADPGVVPPAALVELGVVSSLIVPLDAALGPTGVIALHTTTPRRFGEGEVALTQAVANVLAGAAAAAGREEEARRRAMHDPLTGLANRALLEDRLANALQRAERDSTRVTLLFLDLDDFKAVNDTHGHAGGDVILTVLAGRLRAHFRPADTVARFGGDEFVVLCADLPGSDEGLRLAGRVSEVWQEPVTLPAGTVGEEPVSVPVRGTVGTVTARQGEHDVAALLSRADAAMYRGKRLRGS